MFDVIQSEYGWTDKKILGLRIGRLVQIMSAIRARTTAEMKLRHAELEWQTKALAHFIASTIEDDKGREHMVKAATNLSLMKAHDQIDDVPTADTSRERSIEDIMENGDTTALEKNSKRKGPMPFALGPMA